MGNYNPDVEASVDHVETIKVKKIDLDLTVGFDDENEFKGTIRIFFHEFGERYCKKQIVDIVDHNGVTTRRADENFSWAEALLDALHRFTGHPDCIRLKLDVYKNLPESEQLGYMEWSGSVEEDLQTQMEEHLKSEGLDI